MRVFLSIIFFLMLFMSAVFAILFGVVFTENMSSGNNESVSMYGASSIILGILGSLGVAKINKTVNFWYLFIVFTIAGFVGGMSRFFIPYNDGLMIITIALIFFVFFVIGRIIFGVRAK